MTPPKLWSRREAAEEAVKAVYPDEMEDRAEAAIIILQDHTKGVKRLMPRMEMPVDSEVVHHYNRVEEVVREDQATTSRITRRVTVGWDEICRTSTENRSAKRDIWEEEEEVVEMKSRSFLSEDWVEEGREL